MFYFRINKLKIVDNRESGPVLRVFGKDLAEVKLNSFITTDDTTLPEIDDLLATRDPGHQKELLAAAVNRVVSARVLTTIQNVTDGHEMTFGDTGYVLYQAERIPADFNWLFQAIESDRDERELGDEMQSVVRDRTFDGFVADTLSILTTAANPSFAASIGIAKFVAGTLAQRFRNNKDDMVGLLYTSLNRLEHYPHGERKRDHVPDLTNNMFVDYSIFGFEPLAQPATMHRLPPVAGTIQPRRITPRRAA